MVVRPVTSRLFAWTAVGGMLIANGSLVAQLSGLVSFNVSMPIAIISGIGATLAGCAHLIVRLNNLDLEGKAS